MKFEVIRPHALDAAALHARLRRRFEHYADRYQSLPLRESVVWGDRTARASYRGAGAVLTVSDRTVTARVELPLFARPLRDRIERVLERELRLATEPAGAPGDQS